ncbi:MAG: aldo/keto reductase [Planctomycetota bacterium]|jgi:predicted aldo/keto reductase-like oxidoreductase
MLYHKYGTTGIDVSAIGFGGMRFEDQEDADSCASLMKAAYDAGINYFDTAPGYGKSEELFGVAFKEMKKTRDEKPFYVSTKSWQADPGEVRRDLEQSLEKMGLEYIDFFHVWYLLSLEEYRTRKANGVLKQFERLKDEGLIKHICVSTHMDGSDVSELMRDYPFEGILLGYSAMNFGYRQAGIEAAAELGRAVVVMNPLGGGIIPRHPVRFSFVRTREDETVVEGALRFLLNDPRITISLVGLSNLEQLAEAVSAVDGYRPISGEKVQEIRDSLTEGFNELCTCCRYCEDCPEEIPVPKLMDVYNHHILQGDLKGTFQRMTLVWGIKADTDHFSRCTECGKCESLCTQKLPIIERLKIVQQQIEKYQSEQGTK